MAKEMPSYKNRIDRICNKVQRMVNEVETSKKSTLKRSAHKKTFKEVVHDILTETEEANDA